MTFFDELMTSKSVQTEDNNSLVMTGVVKENYSEENPGCVKVEIILSSTGKNVTDWIPVAVPYCGNGFGQYFMPEIGTHVVMVCNYGNINCPIVIGSLWNQEDVIPEGNAAQENNIKEIRTKGGHTITFEDEKGSITIQTKGKRKLFLDDENESITLSDEEGKNAVVINSKDGEISIKAEKKISLEAGGQTLLLDDSGKKVAIEGNEIAIKNQKSISIEGQNTKIKATDFQVEGSKVTIKSQSNLQAEASAMMQIKGSMTKIN